MSRLLFVTGSMGRGGAERVISILSDYYVKKGFEVDILMLLHSNISGYKLNPAVRIIDISRDTRNAVLDIPRLIFRERKVIKDVKPDVIVCFMAQNVLITGLACKGLKQKLIASERIDPAAVKRNAVYKAILNRIYATCHKTILQTKRAWNYFPEKVRNNSVIIPNPISVECTASGNRGHRIVTAGRLTTQKNHALLIHAFSNIVKNHPEYELNIYGEGPEKDRLSRLIGELGLGGKVKLMGSSAHFHEDIADAGMFVLSSDYEGLSNALLEALMMGVPTISTDCAGSDEVIQNGVNGLLVPVGDQKKLEDAISTIIKDSAFADRLSENGRADALGKYAVDQVIAKWAEIIE